MEKNWIKTSKSTNPIELRIIKEILEDNKIKSVIMSQQNFIYNILFREHIDLYIQKQYITESIELLEINGNEPNS